MFREKISSAGQKKFFFFSRSKRHQPVKPPSAGQNAISRSKRHQPVKPPSAG
jgi:hypothetical protein